jgi:hypothetical protein
MTKRLLLIAAVLAPSFAVLTLAADINHRTNKGAFIFVLKPSPTQPVVGSNSVTLIIRDAGSGAAVEGATVRVVPWMTMHGHGSPKNTLVQDKGGGVYKVNDLDYSMEGAWDLLVTIQKGNVEDSASVKIVVNK